MSFYENRILPYMLNVFMNTEGTREERQRSLADRMNGREGTPVALTIRTPETVLLLKQESHGVHAEVHQIVRGVTIKRSTVGVDDWLVALAGLLSKLAGSSASARDALTKLLG